MADILCYIEGKVLLWEFPQTEGAMSYLNFKFEGEAPSGLTKRWTVYNSQTEIPLGWISWRAGWRKYTFNTLGDISFDASCLDEISAFLKTEMAKR